ncbi:TPA: hypothetical protein QB366_002014 [Pasteurella multocida]|uniref:hypothetical protein n=1 Tax=Pasteurella multocida TaxID=747 RepID=UPI0007ED43F3|nr:hypothetical protein [Pasteurella multocida]MCL7822104.1 hypothetical protein [Pasteurella multocida]OBP34057.1 hypothetical protein A0R74_07415 [Pasteurella multocida subsp. multocida]URH98304.1 hypothetical protein M8854_10555 [Pasteurella multocida]URJ92828.1 hypothetical protein M9419_08645 [Pasteurella multocida]HDR1000672.1 hypothetical protein [Pasteurella multocida]
MRKYSVITYREDETVEGQPFIIATGKTHQEAVKIAHEAIDNDPLVYGSTLRVERSSYEITVFDKQGEIAFVDEYPTYAQACEVSDYLKTTGLYSEIRISNPEGLGE